MNDQIPVTLVYNHPDNDDPRDTRYTVSMHPDVVGQLLVLVDTLAEMTPEEAASFTGNAMAAR